MGTTRVCGLKFKFNFRLPFFVFFYMQNTCLQDAKSLIYHQSRHQALNPSLCIVFGSSTDEALC